MNSQQLSMLTKIVREERNRNQLIYQMGSDHPDQIELDTILVALGDMWDSSVGGIKPE